MLVRKRVGGNLYIGRIQVIAMRVCDKSIAYSVKVKIIALEMPNGIGIKFH